MKHLNEDQVARLNACLDRGWWVVSFFLHDLDTANELEEALLLTDNSGKGEVINDYMRKTLREIHQLWPDPGKLFDQSFTTYYPLISQALTTPGKKRTYLNVVRFANATMNYYSQLIGGILEEHADGANYVERERCRDYGCEPHQNTDCWIYATMASYPAMQCSAAQQVLMPNVQGRRIAGAQYIHCWEWPQWLLATNKHDGPLEIDVRGLGKIEVCDRTGYLNTLSALLYWACELMGTGTGSGYTQWAVLDYSQEKSLLRVAPSEDFFRVAGPTELLISYEDQPPSTIELLPDQMFGKALKLWLTDRGLPHRGQYATGYEITSVDDEKGISIRRNPHIESF